MENKELHTVFKLFPLASVILDYKAPDHYTISLVNEKFSCIMKAGRTKIKGENLFNEDIPFLQQNRSLFLKSLKSLREEKTSIKFSCSAFTEEENSDTIRNFYEIELRPILDSAETPSRVLLCIEDKTETIQEQKEGKRARNYLDNLVNSLPGVAYRCKVDEHWTMKFLSPKVKDITGYPASDFIKNNKRTFSSIILPEDLELTYQALDQIKQRNFFRIKYRLQRADGTIIWVEEQGAGVFTPKGELLYIDGVILDITDKIRQNLEIEKNNRRYQALVQEGSDLISIIDENANFLFASENNEKILGIPPSEFLGKNAFDFIHPEDKERLYANFVELQNSRRVRPQAFRFQDNKKNWRWLECVATNLKDDPAINGIVINSRDITKEFLQREELAKANERFRFAKKATNDALWDLDLISSEIHWGEGYETIFGYEKRNYYYDLYNAENYTKIYPKDVSNVINSLKTAVKDPDCQVWKEKYRYLRADGSISIVSNRAFIIRDKNNRAIRLVGALQDLTEEENRQEQSLLLTGIKSDLQGSAHNGESFPKMLLRLCSYTEADCGELWLTASDEIHHSARIATTELGKKFIEKSGNSQSFQVSEGIYGKEVKDKLLFWNKEELESLPVKNPGFTSACGVPLFSSGKCVGIICFFSTSKNTCDKRRSEVLQAINEEIALTILHKKKEEELVNFFKLSREILCIGGLDGQILRINPAVYDVLGYTAEEVMQQSITKFIHPEDYEKVRNKIVAFKEKTTDLNFEARYLGKDGKVVWISWTTAALHDENLIYAVGKDITASKHAALQLQESTEKLEYAQSIAKLGYWSRRVDEDISEWSKTTFKLFERSPKDFIPNMENVRKAFHPEDRYLLDAHLPKNQFKDFEHRIVTPTGKIKWVFQRIKLVTNNNGDPLRLDGVIQDITENKEKDLQVKVSNERYKIAMKATDEMIWDWDLSTDKVIRSKSYRKIFGYKSSAATSLQDFWFKNVHPEDRAAVINSLTKTLESKHRKKWKMHYRFYKADGEIAYVSDKAFIVRDKNKKAIRVVGAARDVTRSKLMIQEIQQQNKLLKEITWMQSHEVRAPLSRILSLIDLLPEINTEKEQKEFLDYLFISANELDEVIKGVISKTEKLC
ncbi:PAS domain-containing protein [Zunongwangia sp. F363]|uniref:histidine kinase n=1 Tax=Autumnicola tepida TaxID=3075595 RepID=A0ABU3CCF4_9FLAO|nr:PAS domain-containing protein [Zunongwangia sp. F363]MDT0643902.1 PAS domain-containing protein [Zunongwangia sp. F363]